MPAVGAALLALGALLGWLVALTVDRPGVLTRFGVANPHRVRQVHLDFIMMGIMLIAIGTAFPALPIWTQLLVVVGAITNPLLFVPLAFKAELAKRTWFRVASFASFSTVSVGLVLVALR